MTDGAILSRHPPSRMTAGICTDLTYRSISATKREEGKMSDRIALIRKFHGTRSFGTRENLVLQQEKAAELYRTLDPEEARELAQSASCPSTPTSLATRRKSSAT